MGFVTHNPDTGKWIAKGDLRTDKKGGERRIITGHDTIEAAVDALEALSKEYPNTIENAVIIVDDITDGC